MTSNIETSLSESEVKAKYQTMLNSFYQLPADRLHTISMQDREFAAREGTMVFFKRRDGITLSEEQLLAIIG
jgi:hypothetical protein